MGVPIVPLVLLTADALGILPLFGTPQWGVFYQNGQPVLVAESVGELEYDREYELSKYPQEQGAFQTYNKVQIPYSAKITILSNQTRQQLLSTLEPIVASLQLVTVVMPEWGYQNANIIRYGFRRTVRNGVTLLAVDVWCEEVRYGNTMLTSSATPQQAQTSGGTGRPVGQVNGSGSLAAGSTTTITPVSQSVPISQGANQDFTGGAGGGTAVGTRNQDFSGSVVGSGNQDFTGGVTNTSSTNAAYPTTSGPVQPVAPNNAPADWGTVDLTHPPN